MRLLKVSENLNISHSSGSLKHSCGIVLTVRTRERRYKYSRLCRLDCRCGYVSLAPVKLLHTDIVIVCICWVYAFKRLLPSLDYIVNSDFLTANPDYSVTRGMTELNRVNIIAERTGGFNPVYLNYDTAVPCLEQFRLVTAIREFKAQLVAHCHLADSFHNTAEAYGIRGLNKTNLCI